MQLTLSATTFQKQFISLKIGLDIADYKLKLKSFNSTAQLDHSVTNKLFTLIKEELSLIYYPLLSDLIMLIHRIVKRPRKNCSCIAQLIP